MSKNPIRFLSLQNVIQIHDDTIEQEGGEPGLLNEGMVASAVELPHSTFDGEYLYSDLAEMAAALMYHLCKNHGFVDGNKRTAALAILIFVRINGVRSDQLPQEDELENVVFGVAGGNVTKPQVGQFLRDKGVFC